MKQAGRMYIQQTMKTNTPPQIHTGVSNTLKRHSQARKNFSTKLVFEEGDKGTHDLCGKIRRKMEGGMVIDNWVKLWIHLLGKTDFTAQESQHLTLGIRLAKTSPEVYGGWKGNQLMDSTITEVFSGARYMFGELWTKNNLMTDADSWNNKEDLGSQSLLTATKKLCYKEVESILKSPKYNRTKKSKYLKAYFKPRSNV